MMMMMKSDESVSSKSTPSPWKWAIHNYWSTYVNSVFYSLWTAKYASFLSDWVAMVNVEDHSLEADWRPKSVDTPGVFLHSSHERYELLQWLSGLSRDNSIVNIVLLLLSLLLLLLLLLLLRYCYYSCLYYNYGKVTRWISIITYIT